MDIRRIQGVSKSESTEEHQKSMIKDQCPRCLMKKFQDIKVMILIPLLLGLVEQNYFDPYFYPNRRFYERKARN